MHATTVSQRLSALRAECAALGHHVAEVGRGWSAEEAFEVAGEAQKVANAADGLVAVAGAWGARFELRLTGNGPVDRVHDVGFVDAMAAAEMSLATGVTGGLAGRKAALGAALGERFPPTRDLVLSGSLPPRRRTRSWRPAPGSMSTPARGWTPSWPRGSRRWIPPG